MLPTGVMSLPGLDVRCEILGKRVATDPDLMDDLRDHERGHSSVPAGKPCGNPGSRAEPGRLIAMSDVGVFVIGAARSGTSATARLVNALGLQVPEEEHLKQGEEANPDGFLEVTKLTKINHWIMEGFPWPQHGAAAPHRPGGSTNHGSSSSVWAHASFSSSCTRRGRGFWEAPDHLHDAALLAANPRRASRDRRDRPPPARERRFDSRLPRQQDHESSWCPLAIWERYLRSALAYAAGHPTFVVGYRELCDKPHGMVRDLAAFLAANGAISDAPVAEDELAGLVPRDFRHHAVDPDQCRDGDAELSDTQQRLWKSTRELVGPHERFPSLDLGDETEWISGILVEQNRYEWMRDEFRDSERTLKHELSRAEKRYARGLGATQKLEREVTNMRERQAEPQARAVAG